MTWPIAGTIAALSIVAVLRWQREVDRRAWPAWNLTFGGLQHDLIEWLRRELAGHLRVLDGALRGAHHECERGEHEEAAYVLAAAGSTVNAHVNVLHAWLRRCAELALRLAAIKPVPLLPSRRMHLAPLRALALGQRVGDVVLVTSRERFRWSTTVQAIALQLVTWAFGASVMRAQSPQQDEIERAFAEVTRARADLGALNDHVVTTLESLCASLEAPCNARRG